MTKTVILFSMLLHISCSLPSRPPPQITSLRFSPSAFDPFKRNAELRYSLDRDATVSAYIIKKDSIGQRFIVKTLAEFVDETEGTHAHAWLGGNDEGFFVPVGLYFGVIQTEYDVYETSIEVYHE